MEIKQLNKNVKLIAVIILVIIMIVVLITNTVTEEQGEKIMKSHIITYVESSSPKIEHEINITEDNEIIVSSIINQRGATTIQPMIKNLTFSKENMKSINKFLLSYFNSKEDNIIINSSTIFDTSEQYLFETIVYNCEECYELATNKYKYKIKYVNETSKNYIYVLNDNKIKLAVTKYDSIYNIEYLTSYDISFGTTLDNKIINTINDIFKDKKEKELLLYKELLTEEQNNVLVAITKLDGSAL